MPLVPNALEQTMRKYFRRVAAHALMSGAKDW